MSSLIASINSTLDGFCDHTAVHPDDEIHQHYTDLIKGAGALIYGRNTYQLMETYWPTLIKEPSGVKHMDEFARAIDEVQKIVFSRTLKTVSWKHTTLKNELISDEILEMKRSARFGEKPIYVGSPGLIVALSNLGLIDEYQIMVLPVVAGNGLPLFQNLQTGFQLNLKENKTFASGAVLLMYSSK